MKNKKVIFTKDLNDLISVIGTSNFVFTPTYELYVIYREFENVFFLPTEDVHTIIVHILNLLHKYNLNFDEIDIIIKLESIGKASETPTYNMTEVSNQIKNLEKKLAKKDAQIAVFKKRKSIIIFNKVGRFLKKIGVKK